MPAAVTAKVMFDPIVAEMACGWTTITGALALPPVEPGLATVSVMAVGAPTPRALVAVAARSEDPGRRRRSRNHAGIRIVGKAQPAIQRPRK